MKSMLILRNAIHCAFFNPEDENKAKELRKLGPRMKYARIDNIIQAFPSKIEIGKVYLRQ